MIRRSFLQGLFTAVGAATTTPPDKLPQLLSSAAANMTQIAVPAAAPAAPTAARLLIEITNKTDELAKWLSGKESSSGILGMLTQRTERLPEYAKRLAELQAKEKALEQAEKREKAEGKDSRIAGQQMTFLDKEVSELKKVIEKKAILFAENGIDFSLVEGAMRMQLAALEVERETLLETSGLKGLEEVKKLYMHLSVKRDSMNDIFNDSIWQLQHLIEGIARDQKSGLGRIIDLFAQNSIKGYQTLGSDITKGLYEGEIPPAERIKILKQSFWDVIRGELPADHPKLRELLDRSAEEAERFAERVNSRPKSERQLKWQDLLDIDELLREHDRRADDPTANAPHKSNIWRGDIY
jgi:hypothetical protein